MLNCFVITGYGIKKDYINNRDIDLDKTFKYIVSPVFKDLGYDCKRSCDYPPGVIDTIMYKGIFEADFVLADVSTLNPNALYELGVRHALKPFTTLIICEDGILANGKLPFDLNHITALAYRHDGKSLDVEEVDRFKEVLKKAVTGMLAKREVDSPVFTFLQGLEVAIKKAVEKINSIAEEKGITTATKGIANTTASIEEVKAAATGPTLSEMMESAVMLMKSRKFDDAIVAFTDLLVHKPEDPFFLQQLCLATYKAGKPDPIAANEDAYTILKKLNPATSIDTETLGMAGAIHKNLFKLTGEKSWLEKSMQFYQRGYYIANDYYNGINTAFLYWQLASLGDDKEETMFYKLQARQIAKHVAEICNQLISQPDYAKRADKEWIPNTLAEAYFGLDDAENVNKIMEERKKDQTGFSEESFMKQFQELKTIKEKVEMILKG